MSATKLFIGLMSGTSGDAVDATLVAVESEGRMTSIASHSLAIPETVKRRIFAIQTGTDTRIQAVCELDVVLAQLYAQAVEGLLTAADRTRGDIEAIGNHGQTLLHQPNRDPAYTPASG